MKFDVKNCVVGGVSILLAILTFGLLAAPVTTFMGIGGGNMYDLIGDLTGAPATFALASVFSILAIIAAVVLLVFGILTIVNTKHVTGKKASMAIIITTGAIIALAGLFSVIMVAVDIIPLQAGLKVAGGPIVLMIFAIAFIAMPFILKIFFKNKKIA